MLNIHRLIYRAPEVAWNTTTEHLLSVISLTSTPQAIRVQAARVLDEILVVVPRNLSSTADLQAKAQRRVLDVIAKQIVPGSEAGAAHTSTNVELRRMGLEAWRRILRASEHTLVVRWGSIFEMLGSVCKPSVLMRTISSDSVSTVSLQDHRPKPLSLGYNNERGYTALVKITFQSLTLVCDSVSSLSPEDLRLCISALGQFGRQADTNIALIAAESFPLEHIRLSTVQTERRGGRTGIQCAVDFPSSRGARFVYRCPSRSSRERHSDAVPGHAAVWHDAKSGHVERLHVEDQLLDAISIETRRIPTESAGGALTSGSIPSDESMSLALQSIGSIIKEFVVSKIMHLSTFSDAWKVFVAHIRTCVQSGR
jgi:hypothetical protein